MLPTYRMTDNQELKSLIITTHIESGEFKMKKTILATCLTASLLIPTYSYAVNGCGTIKGSNNPGIFAGITYVFGGKQSLGFTLNVTSTRRDDRAVASAGVSYYPSTGSIGLPIGVGYQKSNAAVIGGYDVLLGAPVLQGGYTNTSKDRTADCSAPT